LVELTGDQQVQAEVLEGLATAVNHRQWFVELAEPYLGERAIEVGSGLGDYARAWAASGRHITATEAEPDRLVDLKERLADVPNVDVRSLHLPLDAAYDGARDYSAVVSYNVLEHIEDDVSALDAMRHLVRPGGAVVIIVPAFMFALGPADVATGHVRRYTKQTLTAAMTAAGLTIERMHYANALGLICYYLATCVLKMMPKEGPMVRIYDTFVLPVTKAAERIVRPPFGQSVFAVARRPSSDPSDPR
jgi:2-polyprenyl-3-methyl-5-hydroxy-6-metoxy-1,4-benzoquinol methylase